MPVRQQAQPLYPQDFSCHVSIEAQLKTLYVALDRSVPPRILVSALPVNPTMPTMSHPSTPRTGPILVANNGLNPLIIDIPSKLLLRLSRLGGCTILSATCRPRVSGSGQAAEG